MTPKMNVPESFPIRLWISFLQPYDSQSGVCTAVRMIAADCAMSVPISTPSGVLLSPHGDQDLSIADSPFATGAGVHLLDGPWELLREQAEGFRKRGIRTRRLPTGLEPFNPYYRRLTPYYFFSPERFSTAEAAAYALAILGRPDQGLLL